MKICLRMMPNLNVQLNKNKTRFEACFKASLLAISIEIPRADAECNSVIRWDLASLKADFSYMFHQHLKYYSNCIYDLGVYHGCLIPPFQSLHLPAAKSKLSFRFLDFFFCFLKPPFLVRIYIVL